MPVLSAAMKPEDKAKIIRKLQNVMNTLADNVDNTAFNDADILDISNDPMAAGRQAFASEINSYKANQQSFYDKNYKTLFRETGRNALHRIIMFYMTDNDAENKELLESLKEADGYANFVKRVAADMMFIDPSLTMIPNNDNDPDTDLIKYDMNKRSIQVAWVVKDLTSDPETRKILGDDVLNVLNERLSLTQSASYYSACASYYKDHYAMVMPKLNDQNAGQLPDVSENLIDNAEDLWNLGSNEESQVFQDTFQNDYKIYKTYHKPNGIETGTKRSLIDNPEFTKNFTPEMQAFDKENKPLSSQDALMMVNRGEKVTFKKRDLAVRRQLNELKKFRSAPEYTTTINYTDTLNELVNAGRYFASTQTGIRSVGVKLTKQFSDMQNAVSLAVTELAQLNGAGSLKTPGQLKKYNEILQNVRISVKSYLDYKKNHINGSLAEKRFDTAMKLALTLNSDITRSTYELKDKGILVRSTPAVRYQCAKAAKLRADNPEMLNEYENRFKDDGYQLPKHELSNGEIYEQRISDMKDTAAELKADGERELYRMILDKAAEAETRLHNHLAKDSGYRTISVDIKTLAAESYMRRYADKEQETAALAAIRNSADPEKELSKFINNIPMNKEGKAAIRKIEGIFAKKDEKGRSVAPSHDEKTYIRKIMKAAAYSTAADQMVEKAPELKAVHNDQPVII